MCIFSEDEDFGILLQALESECLVIVFHSGIIDSGDSICLVYEEKASHLSKPELPKLMCIITGLNTSVKFNELHT